jgi:hypothetical protein
MRVLQLFEYARLLEKVVALLLRIKMCGVHQLDSAHTTGKDEMLAFIDTSKGSTTNLGNDSIVADLLADIAVSVRHAAPPSWNDYPMTYNFSSLLDASDASYKLQTPVSHIVRLRAYRVESLNLAKTE